VIKSILGGVESVLGVSVCVLGVSVCVFHFIDLKYVIEKLNCCIS